MSFRMEHERTYTGEIVDTHTFLKREGDTFGQLEGSGPFFEEPQFDDTKFLVIATDASSNAAVHREVLRKPNLIGSYLMFNPEKGSFEKESDDSPRAIQMLAEEQYVVGLKTLPGVNKVPLNDKRYEPYWDIAVAQDIPVLVHFGATSNLHASAAMVQEVTSYHKDLKIIAAHFGGMNPEYMEQMIRLAERRPNLYFNTTAMSHAKNPLRFSPEDGVASKAKFNWKKEQEEEQKLKEIYALFFDAAVRHPGRILFGSDLGYHPVEDYSHWPVNKLPQEHQGYIYKNNPKRLFGQKLKS